MSNELKNDVNELFLKKMFSLNDGLLGKTIDIESIVKELNISDEKSYKVVKDLIDLGYIEFSLTIKNKISFTEKGKKKIIPFYIPKITKQLEEDIKILNNDIRDLHTQYKLYFQVYGNEESIQVLNKSANFFFYHLHFIYIDAIILSVTRLTEEPGFNSFKNLNLRQLKEQILKEKYIDDIFREKLEQQLQIIVKLAKNFEKKGINQLLIKIEISFLNKTKVKITNEKVKNIISEIDNFMNLINQYFTNSKYDYSVITSRQKDGRRLINDLKKINQ